MSGPQYLRTPTVLRLPSVLEEIRTGQLRIPPFQREFVWTQEQRLLLLNSIHAGLPSGSLMVWRTRKAVRHVRQVGPFALSFDAEGGEQYLLDGLQRVTTLFSALGLGLWTRGGEVAPREEGSVAPDDSPWAVNYDVTNGEFVFPGEMDADRESPPWQLFPLDRVLDDDAYDRWRDEVKPPREEVAKVRALRSAFQDYLIPVTPLVTDDIQVVTTTFKRVNSSGTPMDDVHMARALTWTADFDLLLQIEERSAELEEQGWASLDPSLVLKVVAPVVGLDATAFDIEELSNKVRGSSLGGPDDSINAAFAAIREVIKALRSLGFAGPRMLPAAYALVLGAAAVHQVQRSGRASLKPDEARIVRAWIAKNLLFERFSEPPHVLRGLQRRLEEDLNLRSSSDRRGKARTADEAKKFNLTWSRSRAIAAALAHRGPRDPSGRRYRDPAGLLIEHGSDALPLLLQRGARGLPANIQDQLTRQRLLGPELLRPANRLLCDPADAKALRELLTTGKPDKAFLDSHALDEECVRMLKAGDLHRFIQHRRVHIRSAETDWAAAHGVPEMIIKKGPEAV